jgi:hypothetical protein
MKEDQFDADAFRTEIRPYTEERLKHLLDQIGRNGETGTSRSRQEIIESELQSRERA